MCNLNELTTQMSTMNLKDTTELIYKERTDL